MTALAAEAARVTSGRWIAGADSIGWSRTAALAPQTAESLVLGHHRPDNHIVPFFQFPFENCADLRVGVVCDSKRNLNRFHRVIRMELPNYGSICFRSTREILSVDAGRLPNLRRRRVIDRLPLSRFDPVAFIKRNNLLCRHGRLVP